MSHVFHPSQPTPEWVAQADPVTDLIAFWVGELDMYAALSPGHALAMALEKFGPGVGDAKPVSADVLDRAVVNKGGEYGDTLRQWLARKTEPGWLARRVWVEVDLETDFLREVSAIAAPVVDLLGDVPAAAPLGAYWVGEHDVYAAHSPEQALELCEGHSGMPDTFDMDDVREMTAGELDKPLQEEDGTPCGTVRQMLAAMTAPGELVSFE